MHFPVPEHQLENKRYRLSVLNLNVLISRYSKSMCHLINYLWSLLTHWGRVTHLYISNLTIIGSDNDLSPGRCQAIIWTSAGVLLTGPSGTNFSEILITIHTFSFKKMHLNMEAILSRPLSVKPMNWLIKKKIILLAASCFHAVECCCVVASPLSVLLGLITCHHGYRCWQYQHYPGLPHPVVGAPRLFHSPLAQP